VEGASAATTVDAGLTSEGSILGTASYMSPEQATGRQADGRSDIFSLALVLLECWQGRHPFLRDNVRDTLHAIAHDRLPALAYPAGSPEGSGAGIREGAGEGPGRALPDNEGRGHRPAAAPAGERVGQTGPCCHGRRSSSRQPTAAPLRSCRARPACVAGGSRLVPFPVPPARRAAAPPRLEYTQLTNFADSAVDPALSPDGRMLSFLRGEDTFGGPSDVYVWVLVAEMDLGGWQPCRLVPFDGSSLGKRVGPSPAKCTNAAWSVDGKWMYFSANTGNGFHIWRQRFPDGEPEQVTSGATEEEGVAFFPDGRSFVTSVETSQNTLWLHDARGDRQITSQGYAYLPSFSADGKRLYYLVRSRPTAAL